MTFARPTLPQLIDRVRADFETFLGGANVRLRRTVEDVLARALAGLAHGLHGHAEWISRQMFPQTADDENLARWAELLGVELRTGDYSRGIAVSDASGFIPTGHELVGPDGETFVTEYEIAVLPGAMAEMWIRATEVGTEYDLADGTVLTLNPAFGAHTEMTIAPPGLSGGFPAETADQFRDRVVRRLALPVRGGTAEDFVTWALEVPGVLRANYTINGAGDVDLYPLDLASDGYSPSVPSLTRIDLIQDYIDARLPIGFVCAVTQPTGQAVAFTIEITDGDSTETREAVEVALLELFSRYNVGEDVILSQVSAAISSAEGERDHILSSPASNVAISSSQYAVLGTITWV